jgi:hypothetical protein
MAPSTTILAPVLKLVSRSPIEALAKVKAHVDVTTRVAVARATGMPADHAVVLTGPNGRD